jgi:hypothetical protein
MKGYEQVRVTVTVPAEFAVDAEVTDRDEPEFFSRVVTLALTRRAIYRGIRDRARARTAEA